MTTQSIDSATRSTANAFRRRLDHQFEVQQTLLFGSRTRCDNHHESDADVADLLNGEPGKFIDTKLAMDGLQAIRRQHLVCERAEHQLVHLGHGRRWRSAGLRMLADPRIALVVPIRAGSSGAVATIW